MTTLAHPSGLAQAMRHYRRLCADPASGVINRVSAIPIIVEGLAGSPCASLIMHCLAKGAAPMRLTELCRAIESHADLNNIGGQLLPLLNYDLVVRTSVQHRWRYTLSALGQMVMRYEREA